jgi:hypothetical protein
LLGRGCLCSALADLTVRDEPACCSVLLTIHSTQHSPVVCCLGSYSIASCFLLLIDLLLVSLGHNPILLMLAAAVKQRWIVAGIDYCAQCRFALNIVHQHLM